MMCNYFRNIPPMKIEALHRITKALERNETFCQESDEVFLWTDYPGVAATLKIMMESGAEGMFYVALHLFPLDRAGAAEEKAPEILPIPTVSYLLKDRVNGYRNVVRSSHSEFGCEAFSYDMDFECRLCPKSLLTSPNYQVNDAVKVEVFVESPAVAGAFHSEDGTLQWTIESWSCKRQALLNGFVDLHRSPYFYTREGGYRVQACISMATAAADLKDLVVDIVFLTGVNDSNNLTKSFPHLTTVKLKNPRHPDESVAFQSVEREQASRYQLVFPGERVPFEILLADDSFLLQVVIRAK